MSLGDWPERASRGPFAPVGRAPGCRIVLTGVVGVGARLTSMVRDRPVWAAIAATPVLWLVAVAIALLAGHGADAGMARVGALLLYLVALAAPTAAVLLALEEQPTEVRHRKSVLVVTGGLLVATFVVLPVCALGGPGLEWLLAVGVVLAVLARFGGQLPARVLPERERLR